MCLVLQVKQNFATFFFLCIFGILFNVLPDDKLVDWSKLKAFADDIIMLLKYDGFSLCKKTLWEKDEMLVPKMFSKDLFFRIVKSLDCVVKELLCNFISFSLGLYKVI